MVAYEHVAISPPVSLLAELTHRCPLQCPYCSNPVELERAGVELDTPTWRRVLDEAGALGVLQVHFSGGEPTARRDLVDLVRHAALLGQYSNLITSGILLDEARLDALVAAGLDHLQLSIQDSRTADADRIGGYHDGHRKKLRLAAMVRAAGLPLTINAVVHRQNLDHLEEIIDLADQVGAQRLEVAHVQYHGWALVNRAALMPTREQTERAMELVRAARERLKGVLAIDYVVPDYYARYPKPCMGGWGRQNLNVTPSGKVLPCHAAETITSLRFDSVTERRLADIWYHSAAFNAFRGTDWMSEPCRSCERRTLDFGGCRCQAFAIAGRPEATDPACSLSPLHDEMVATACAAAAGAPPAFVYRRFGNAGAPAGKELPELADAPSQRPSLTSS
ncbi:MAG TPA: pyrroloquinoline quinone biosynthesis protein PqqE [Geminicoccaceae bacterium]|nr:pyrroloquinoline quinone biosynthesis protein PqqE [Geminicoccaceae bacterium]